MRRLVSPHRHSAVVLLVLLFFAAFVASADYTAADTEAATKVTVSLNAAQPAPEHLRCGFDELEARTRGTRVMGISRIVQPNAPHRNIDAEAAPAADAAAWEPIRIRVFTEDLNNARRYCFAADQPRPNFHGGTVTCTSDDVLTNGKKTVLADFLVPSAIKLHEDRLNVQRVNGNIVVDAAAFRRDPICGQFTIPAAHTTTGVSDADFVLYLSAGPTSGNTIAWASTCQQFTNGRPSVGVSNVSPKYISSDPQTMRVIAHEILHALGFNVNVFRSRSMLSTASLRGKGPSPVLTSANVVAKAQAQYGCTTQTFMELEDQGGDSTASSHWKRRSAKDELMAGISGVGHYTALTIAAMEDTGFYKGNYTNAEPMSYGQNAGCALTTTKCVESEVSQFSDMFCDTDTGAMTCTSDHTALGYCNVVRFTTDLPSYFQYFSNPAVGGIDPLTDFCPFTQPYANANCTTDNGLLLANTYGINARCFNVPTGFVFDGYGIEPQRAICAEVECGTSTYGVKVAGASSYTACTPGATLSLTSLNPSFYSGSLTCPGYDDVCIGRVNATEYQVYRVALGDTSVNESGSVAASTASATLATVLMLLTLCGLLA